MILWYNPAPILVREVMKLFLCLLLGACAVPTSETRAVRDQKHLLYLRTVELPEVSDPRELVICKWAGGDEPSDCQAVFVSRSNKRIIFSSDSRPYINQNHGQREQWLTVGAPAMFGSLVYFYSKRRMQARIIENLGKIDGVVGKLPRKVATIGVLTTVGALFWAVLFEGRSWGAGKRALARNFYAIFDRETDPSGANEVRDLAPLIKALANELDLVISRPVKELIN